MPWRRTTHSNNLNWKIPRTEERGGLQSMGLQRVGHDWASNTYPHWFHQICSNHHQRTMQHKERSFIYISYVATSVYPSFLNTPSSATMRWFSILEGNKKSTVTSTFPSLPTIRQALFLKLWIQQYTEQIKDLVYILLFCLTHITFIVESEFVAST